MLFQFCGIVSIFCVYHYSMSGSGIPLLNCIVIVSCVCTSLYGSTFYVVYVLFEDPSLCLS